MVILWVSIGLVVLLVGFLIFTCLSIGYKKPNPTYKEAVERRHNLEKQIKAINKTIEEAIDVRNDLIEQREAVDFIIDAYKLLGKDK